MEENERESAAHSKPKQQKVSNCGVVYKKYRNTVFWRFPHKSEANCKSAVQSTRVSYQKAAQKRCTIFTNSCIHLTRTISDFCHY